MEWDGEFWTQMADIGPVELDLVKLNAEVLGDCGAAGQDGDILQHGFAAIAEAGSLDRRHFEPAAQLIDHQGGERLLRRLRR